MGTRHWPILAVILFLFCGAANATTYTGSINYNPPPDGTDDMLVFGTANGWPIQILTVSWTVTDTDLSQPGFPWKYTYQIVLNTTKYGYSHVIIETTPCGSLSDFTGFSNAAVESFGDQTVASSNINMPEDFYGLRLNPGVGGVTNWTFSFFSTRAPVWGDIYLRDGGNPVNSAFNKGFTVLDTDRANGAWEGTLANHYFQHILRPDSVVPEPISLAFFATGLMAVSGYFGLRRRAQK